MISTIERALLEKLFARGALGANHYRIETLEHMGWKAHERGDVKRAASRLLAAGLLRRHNRAKGSLQLNNDRLQEILRIIEEGP